MESNGQWIGRMYQVDAKTGKYKQTEVSQASLASYKSALDDKIAKGEKAGATEQDKKEAQEAKTRFEEVKKSLAGAKINVDLLFDSKIDQKRAALKEEIAKAATPEAKAQAEKILNDLDSRINTELNKFNSRAWSGRPDDEKKLVGNIARQYAHVEWSKQDPQVQTNKTGRFSYIEEGYDANGNTVDQGLTDEGKEKIVKLAPGQANRMHTHSRTVLMYKHADEVINLNRGVYDRLLEDIGNSAKYIDLQQKEEDVNGQLNDFIAKATSNIPALTDAEKEMSRKMVKDAIYRSLPKEKQEEIKRSGRPPDTRGYL